MSANRVPGRRRLRAIRPRGGEQDAVRERLRVHVLRERVRERRAFGGVQMRRRREMPAEGLVGGRLRAGAQESGEKAEEKAEMRKDRSAVLLHQRPGRRLCPGRFRMK